VNRTTIKIGQESKPEIRLAGASAVVAKSHRVGGSSSSALSPTNATRSSTSPHSQGPDDLVGALAEIIRKFGRHNLGKTKHQLVTVSSPSVAADGCVMVGGSRCPT
jgi:hypothetical protein